MIQGLRESGRTVELFIEGDPGPLPAGVDLTAYRIVEAALAEADPRPTREVRVVLRFDADRVEIEITGRALHLSAQLRLRLSERAALCNGAVLPRARPSGVPQLTVRLPLAVPAIPIATPAAVPA